jgi:hypothetical protein
MSEERELIDALAAANEDRAQLRAAVVDLRGQLEGARREQDETERWLRSRGLLYTSPSPRDA